jgi:hypothetical protein
LLQDQQLSVEFITMLLDQILSTGLLIWPCHIYLQNKITSASEC